MTNLYRGLRSQSSTQTTFAEPSTDPGPLFDDVDNVKETWNGTFIYLPDELKSRVEMTYAESRLTYRQQHGRDLEKMREFYPLLVYLGLEWLDSCEDEELAAALTHLADDQESADDDS
ncbi:hypothetical protein OB955_15080 [Halobacteria archaeon AArc-m2/3/4]|uniref:DUF8160 domain-containing protein n=1 Tax=Natronoglomus mannanivorans TaxID=2979990 RepID=A0AAP2Z2Z8_9EURY|nr:hypothetical protein [Halobacteria archaeon AArc-xg1-1]MCU4974051.1 hypothetical protein [Halobacteria archaeon AArc-m2/3/4]